MNGYRHVIAAGIFFVTSAARADAIVLIPQPALTWNRGLLYSSLLLGQPGVSIIGHTGTGATGGSFTAFRGAFLFEKSDDARASGWSWGVGAGVSKSIQNQEAVLAPSTYWWELALGRGTSGSITGGDTGLRGYLEVSFRDQRPERSGFLNDELNTEKMSLSDHNTALGFRMGVANDFSGEGLVAQSPPFMTFRLIGAIQLPVFHTDNKIYMTLENQDLFHCGIENLSCGLALNFLNSINSVSSADNSLQEMHRQLAYGAAVEYRWAKRYAFTGLLQWSWITGNTGANLCGASPALDLNLAASF